MRCAEERVIGFVWRE